MAFEKLKLSAPNDLPIIGVKLNDGKVEKIECYNDRKTYTQDWIVPLNMYENDGRFVFFDSSQKEWALNPSDVVLKSI